MPNQAQERCGDNVSLIMKIIQATSECLTR